MTTLFVKNRQVAPLNISPVLNSSGISELRASFAQQRVWFDRSRSFGPMNILLPLVIKQGSMSIERIRSAIRATIERHEILRTALYFNETKNELEQKVQPIIADSNYSFQLTYGVNSSKTINSLLTDDFNRNFSKIDCGLVVRCHLITTNEVNNDDLHAGDVVVFIFDSIAFDDNSIDPFLQTFIQAYEKIEFDIVIPQYIDFSIYEHAQLLDLDQNSKMNRARYFWSTTMDEYYPGNSKDTLLENSNIKTKIHSASDYSISFTLDSNIVNGQMKFISLNHLSMFQVNLACYFLLLYKLSNCETNDLCVTYLSNNRLSNEMKTMIGIFEKLLPFRIKINHSESFIDFVRRVKQLYIDVFKHAYLPYQQIMSVNNISSIPKIPFHFNFEPEEKSTMNRSMYEWKTKDATLILYTDRNWSTNYKDYLHHSCLSMKYDHQTCTIHGILEGSNDFFDEETMSMLCKSFQKLHFQLFSSVQNRKSDQVYQPIGELSLFLSQKDAEIQQTSVDLQLSVSNTGIYLSC